MSSESDRPQQDNRGEPAPVSYLDQALWRHLAEAGDPDQFASAWLALQCAMISGCQAGLVVRRDDDGKFVPAAVWPETGERSRALSEATEHALRETRGVVHKPDDNGDVACIAWPLKVNGETFVIAAVEVQQRSDVQLRSVMRQLQWGTSWFEIFHRRGLPAEVERQNENLAIVLKLVASSLDHAGFSSAVTALATELAAQLNCERVSIGFSEGKHMRVRAISNSAQFDKRANLVQQIALAMDEARDQLDTIVCPPLPTGKFSVTRVHETLLASGGNGSAATVLIATGDDVEGAITLEHQDRDFFTRDKLNLCKQIALLVGPILELKRRDERPLIQKVRDSLADFGRMLIGEEYLLAKTIVGALAAVILYLGIATGDHRVSADATLEGSIQRHISAPLDGYVNESFARAGDLVREGDPLFSLDDKDLMLERLKWSSQRLQIEQKYRDALANHDKAEASIQKAQLDQASAQIALIDSQLSRTRATAPFDGVIVSGDLSQKLGAPVQKGDTLLKVAPLDSYRIILDVDEMDIGWLSEDQQGELSLSSLPGETFAFVVEKITPESMGKDGRNTFRVEARLLEQTDSLRPGMQGSGKVLIGQRSQLWIWTHGFFDWLRVWWWSFTP